MSRGFIICGFIIMKPEQARGSYRIARTQKQCLFHFTSRGYDDGPLFLRMACLGDGTERNREGQQGGLQICVFTDKGDLGLPAAPKCCTSSQGTDRYGKYHPPPLPVEPYVDGSGRLVNVCGDKASKECGEAYGGHDFTSVRVTQRGSDWPWQPAYDKDCRDFQKCPDGKEKEVSESSWATTRLQQPVKCECLDPERFSSSSHHTIIQVRVL